MAPLNERSFCFEQFAVCTETVFWTLYRLVTYQ